MIDILNKLVGLRGRLIDNNFTNLIHDQGIEEKNNINMLFYGGKKVELNGCLLKKLFQNTFFFNLSKSRVKILSNRL